MSDIEERADLRAEAENLLTGFWCHHEVGICNPIPDGLLDAILDFAQKHAAKERLWGRVAGLKEFWPYFASSAVSRHQYIDGQRLIEQAEKELGALEKGEVIT